jgi:hypothetical protein
VKWKGAPITTKAEIEYMALVRALPCLCCGIRPVVLHHIKSGNKKMGERFVLPLCEPHHVGPRMSVHRTRYAFIMAYGTERMLWESVQRKLGLPITGWPSSKILPRRTA